jgi:hypothetical protein
MRFQRKKAEPPARISSGEIYKMALTTRNLEINLFWQRCNYFLILNSALAYAYVTATDKNLSLPIAILGFIVCVFWYRVALGSKYWQEHWEAKLNEVETIFKADKTFPSRIKLFTSTWQESHGYVARSMGTKPRSVFESIVAAQVLSKPSVTLSMMYLVLAFCAGWIGIFLYQMYQLTQGFIQ